MGSTFCEHAQPQNWADRVRVPEVLDGTSKLPEPQRVQERRGTIRAGAHSRAPEEPAGQEREDLCSATCRGPRGRCLSSEWPRQWDGAIELVEPTLRGEVVAVQIALRADLVTTLDECQQPAPWNTVLRVSHVTGKACRIDERRVPAAFYVGLSAVSVLRSRVSMPVLRKNPIRGS
jgi:hypothetical protein